MRFLAENGLIAAAHDHRGHGKSVKEEADLGWFGDKKARAVVEDAVLVTRKLKERYPNLPVTLFGHSMGSMVVLSLIHIYLYFYSASNPFAFSQVLYLASYFRSVTGSSFAVMATV